MAARARPRRRVTRVFLRNEDVAPEESSRHLKLPCDGPVAAQPPFFKQGMSEATSFWSLPFWGRFRHRLWKWSRSIAAGMSQKGQFWTLSYVRGCFDGPLRSASDVRKTTVSDPVFMRGLLSAALGRHRVPSACGADEPFVARREVREPTGQRDGRSAHSSCRPVRLDT
jgi:hypothetical protein